MTLPAWQGMDRWLTPSALNSRKAAWAGALLLGVLVLGLIGRLLAYPLQHDEQIHVTAGVLMSDYRLYYDLGYNHLPNLPLCLNALFQLTGASHYILAGRLLTCLWWLLALAALGMIAWRQVRQPFIVIAALILLVTNVLFLGQAALIVNNNMAPVAFALWGLHFFLRASEGPVSRPLMSALSGFFIAAAIGFKVNYIFLAPPFALAVLLMPAERPFARRITGALLPMLLGGVIGGLPTLIFLASDPQLLLAHTVRYFTTAHKAYWLSLDQPKTMTLAAKVLIAESVWFAGTTLLTLVAAAALWLLSFTSNLRPGRTKGPIVLVAALALGGAAVSFVPTPSFAQYYTPPMAMLIVLVLLLYAQLGEDGQKAALPLIIAVSVLSLAGGASRLGPGLHALATPKKWEGFVIHKQAVRIREAIGRKAGSATKVATLSPIYALEAGLPIYPEFGAGPFLYRVADFIPSDDRRYFRTTSAGALSAFLDASPPAAIVTGDEEGLDDGLITYARTRGFSGPKPLNREGSLVVYVRPEHTPSPGFSGDLASQPNIASKGASIP